jgi:hypothetical protein
MDGMAEWQSRPLDAVYPVVFIDAIHVKIRDGAVANRPIYVALAVTTEGRRDILGCGPETAAKAPSTGCTSSPRSRTAASAQGHGVKHRDRPSRG